MATPILSTARTRPDLLEAALEATRDAFPEYNNHGDVVNLFWPRLVAERPDFQFQLTDSGDRILARGRSIPMAWDGSVDDLPAGLDGALARGFSEATPNALCALLMAVPKHRRTGGLSTAGLEAMKFIAAEHGFNALVAPVRPSGKVAYPTVAIERYANWRRHDGMLFDPWMRVHERLGATVLKAEPHSLHITGSIAEWETWTRMSFPASGEFWFPGGLATLTVDRSADRCEYWEPNVWMHHRIDPPTPPPRSQSGRLRLSPTVRLTRGTLGSGARRIPPLEQ